MGHLARIALEKGVKDLWANSFSQHHYGRKVSVAIDEARQSIASTLGVNAKGVRFTSGSSESNSWILNHFSAQGNVLVSAIEHPSVLSYGNLFIPVDTNGVVSLSELERLLEDPSNNISVVSVMGANNETGVIQPTDDIFNICTKYSVPFHCDATQLLGKTKMTPKADFLSYSGHKIGGPKGIGCAVLSEEITPLIKGGPQERASRAGTHNGPAILGFAAAVNEFQYPDLDVREQLESGLSELGAEILGKKSNRLCNTVCALFKVPGDLLMMALDMRGICVSTGAACSSGASKQSHVLKAMGFTGLPVRFSFGPDFNTSDCEDVLKAVRDSMEGICEW
jgi:cysteine desulfurase